MSAAEADAAAASGEENVEEVDAADGGGVPERHQLSAADIAEFREIFNLVDTDGSGAISTEELAQLVESVGMKLSQQELAEMVNELDEDQSGEVEFEEFIAILSKDLALEYNAEEINLAFKMFSRNAPPGLIRMSDLEEALKVYLRKGTPGGGPAGASSSSDGKGGKDGAAAAAGGVDPSEINALLKQFEDCVTYVSGTVDADGFPVPFFRYQDYINLMMRQG